jgi:hypothetical protein
MRCRGTLFPLRTVVASRFWVLLGERVGLPFQVGSALLVNTLPQSLVRQNRPRRVRTLQAVAEPLLTLRWAQRRLGLRRHNCIEDDLCMFLVTLFYSRPRRNSRQCWVDVQNTFSPNVLLYHAVADEVHGIIPAS